MADPNPRTDSPADENRDTVEDPADTETDTETTGSKAPSNLAEALDVSIETPDDGNAPRGVKA